MLSPRLSSEAVTSHAREAFAVFEGTLDRDRVTRLLSHRSLWDRTATLAIWTAVAGIVFALSWAMGVAKDMPPGATVAIAGCVSCGLFAFGLLQQFGAWHSRRWLRWNKVFAGRYRIVLDEQYVEVQTSSVALRIPYQMVAAVDSGLSCVRTSMDSTAVRALLLPIEDCRPRRSVGQVKAFVQERRRAAKGRPLDGVRLSDRQLPVPFEMGDGPERVEIHGPLLQAHVVTAVESNRDDLRLHRVRGWLYVGLAVCFVFLLGMMTFGAAAGRRLAADEWITLGSVGVFLLLVGGGALAQRWVRADAQANPHAEAGYLTGWASPKGLAIHSGHAYAAVTWSACDVVEVTQDQIVARFWSGEMLPVARHMFRSDAEFQEAVSWATRGKDSHAAT